MDNQKESSIGTTIASIVVILVILIGGLYFWSRTLSKNPASVNNAENATNTVESIRNDLNSIDTQNLDEGFSDLNKEIK